MEMPWLTKRRWRDNRIRSAGRFQHWMLAAFALLWNGITYLAISNQPGSVLQLIAEKPQNVFILLFPIVGLILIWVTLSTFRKWYKFGPSPLTLDPFPGSIGGQVGGHIDTRIPYRPDQRFEVVLQQLKSRVSGSGKSRRRRESVQWQIDGLCHTARTIEGTRLTFRFDVPEGQPVSDIKKRQTYNLWRVTVSSALDGPDFERGFEIPVFATGAKSSIRNATESYAGTQERAEEKLQEVADIKNITGGIEAHFEAFKRPSSGVVFLLVGMGSTALGIYLGLTDQSLVFASLATFFGLGSSLLALWNLGKSLRVRVTQEGVQSRRLWFGYPIKTRRLLKQNITSIDIAQTGSQTSGNKTTVFHALRAKGGAGETIVLGERMTSMGEAKLLKDTIEYYMGWGKR